MHPAMVPRLFGSKEALFTQIAHQAFRLEPAFEGPVEGLGGRVARHLLGPILKTEPGAFDEFLFLRRSAGSPEAAPILSAALHADFILPLSKRMSGAQAVTRAALIAAYVLGFSVLRGALGSPGLDETEPDFIVTTLGNAIQAALSA